MLKELEKMGPKLKGIVSQSVKDVLQYLVDDNLVNCEKIGTSNYFWAFPSQASHLRKKKIADLQAEKQKYLNDIEDLERKIAMDCQGKEDTDERKLLLEKLATANSERDQLHQDLEKYKELDPEAFEKQKKENLQLTSAINLWTDNIFEIQSYCSKTFNLGGADFLKQFSLPEEIEYVE